MKRFIFLISLAAAACGGGGGGGDDDDDDGPDAAPGSTITVSGTAVEVSAGGSDPLEGVLVEAFSNANESTPVATAMTDASGNYTLTVPITGGPLDGYLKATKAQLMDTYLYPPFTLTGNFSGASLNMVAMQTFGLLGTLCGATQDAAKGTIAVLVATDAMMASTTTVAGASIASSPAATNTCYNGSNGLPDSAATATEADGIGYLFNVTGAAEVSATKTGSTFDSHSVTARAGALTTTLVVP